MGVSWASGLRDDLAGGEIPNNERSVVYAGDHPAHACCQLVISSVDSKIYRVLVVDKSSKLDRGSEV